MSQASVLSFPQEEALLVATACSNPPAGRARWTLELLAGELVRLALTANTKGTVRRALNDDQLVKLLGYQGTKRWHDKLHALMRLALITGARIEELCSLKAGAVERREDGWWIEIEKGKTEAAQRKIPIHALGEKLIEKLLEHQGEFLVDGLSPGRFGDRSHYASKAYGRFRREAGVGERGNDFHALRNTFITAMEGAEVVESTVKLLVGHRRASMTFGLYSRGGRVDLRGAINKLGYAPEVERLLVAIPPRA